MIGTPSFKHYNTTKNPRSYDSDDNFKLRKITVKHDDLSLLLQSTNLSDELL